MLEWGMRTPYDTLISLIEQVDSEVHGDDGISLVEHAASLLSHLPPTPKQARTLFDALFIGNNVIAQDLSAVRKTLLGFCEPWIDPDDRWHWRTCYECIKANDASTLDVLLGQPGAPNGHELSSKPIPSQVDGIVGVAIRTQPPGSLLDVLQARGADFNLPCFFGGGKDGLPLSYQPSAERTGDLLERGARLSGLAPDGKPIRTKVFRNELDIDVFGNLALKLAALSNTLPQVQQDLHAIWPDLVPWMGVYLARKPYNGHNHNAMRAIHQMAFAAGLTVGSEEGNPSLLAHWARDILLHHPNDKETGTLSPRPLWAQVAKSFKLTDAWSGEAVPGIPDGVWGLLSDIQSTQSGNLDEAGIAQFIGKDTDKFWKAVETVALENSHQDWMRDAVARLRAYMPAEVRSATCQATGKAFYAVLAQNPREVSKNPRGGMSILSQCLKSVGNDRDEFVDRELVSMALAAHMMTGWQSKVAIKALERLAKEPPDWLDVPMIMAAYQKCPRKIKPGEARNLEAWLVSLNTANAPLARRPGPRL